MGSEGLEFFLKLKKIQCALTRYDDADEIRVHESASHEMLTPAPVFCKISFFNNC